MATEDEEFEALSKKLDAPTIDISKRKTLKTKVILIGHKKRQGKDTFAELLVNHLNHLDVKTTQLSFAYPMKKIIAEALGIEIEILEHLKNTNDYYREMLQKFGSGLMKKHFGDTVWRDLAINQISELEKEGYGCVIISDFRFPCEYIEGATTINIKRDGGNADAHISETALDNHEYDYTIDNTGSLTFLDDKAHNFAYLIALGGIALQKEDGE